MKPLATLNIVLLSVLAFFGCSTADLPRQSSIAELQRQREAAADKAVYEESMRKSYEAAYTSQKSEVERLRVEIESLKQSQKTNATNNQACNQWLQYLRINDALLENHDAVVKDFNAQYSTNRQVLFSAAGGTGKLLDFAVDDVFFYKGVVVVSSLFLWENQDGSGGLGRCALSMDPNKNFDALGCEMRGQIALSRQDLTALLQDGNGAGVSSERLEHAAAQVPNQPSSASKPLVSEATKEKLISAGIGVVSAWLIHAIQSGQ
jgi:hypothetical protein